MQNKSIEMQDLKINDLLNWENDPEIKSLLNSEKLFFSDKITKVNHYGISQERSIILTDRTLYNMKKKV